MSTTTGYGSTSALPAGTSRRKRLLRSCLVISGAGALGAIALIAFALIQLAGGFPWAFTDAPEATDQEVVTTRAEGEGQRDALVSTLQAGGATAGLALVAKTSPDSSCRTGQHNWKINNDYDLQCETTVSVVLGSTHSSETALRTELLTFDAQLAAAGWQPMFATTHMTTIKDIVNQPVAPPTSGSQPFAARDRTAMYFHGERGGQGSATITMRFAADRDDWGVRQLKALRGSRSAEVEPNALRDTEAFLRTADAYIVNVRVTYVAFSG